MKLLLVFKKKFKNGKHEFCLFCGDREEPFYDVNPYHGKIELELANDDNKNNELRDHYSINEEDWLLP